MDKLQLLTCLVAEQVRPEPGNKMNILGYMGVSPDVQLYSPQFPFAANLALIFQFAIVAETGQFMVQVSIEGPNGTVLPLRDSPDPIRVGAGMNASLVLGLQGMPIPEPGRYIVNIYRDGDKVCDGSFVFKLGNSPSPTGN